MICGNLESVVIVAPSTQVGKGWRELWFTNNILFEVIIDSYEPYDV